MKHVSIDEPLSSREAAKLMGYSNPVSYLRAVRKYGIPHIRINEKKLIFDRASLERWKQSRTIGN